MKRQRDLLARRKAPPGRGADRDGRCTERAGPVPAATLPACASRQVSPGQFQRGRRRAGRGSDQLLKDRASRRAPGRSNAAGQSGLRDVAQRRSCRGGCTPAIPARPAAGRRVRSGRAKGDDGAIQSAKPMPCRPSGAGTSLRSRWVWALIKPGSMATLPRSSTGPRGRRGADRRDPSAGNGRRCRRPAARPLDREDVTGTEGCTVFSVQRSVFRNRRHASTLAVSQQGSASHALPGSTAFTALPRCDGLLELFFRLTWEPGSRRNQARIRAATSPPPTTTGQL